MKRRFTKYYAYTIPTEGGKGIGYKLLFLPYTYIQSKNTFLHIVINLTKPNETMLPKCTECCPYKYMAHIQRKNCFMNQ